MLDSSPKTDRALRHRSLSNLSRMGHCAPAIMQTMLDASETEAEWLVMMTAGLPGGIGNTGEECGGVTAALLLLGLRSGGEPDGNGLPMIIYKGHDLLRRFHASHGTTSCREIRGARRVPLRCVRVVRDAPSRCAQTLGRDCRGCLSHEQREAYAYLHAFWDDHAFHCAQTVLGAIPLSLPDRAVVDLAVSGFMGGTVFAGMTCSAFTAGVMALGLQLGTPENSRLRVLRMIATMAVGGDAFTDDMNAFNKVMNLGHHLSHWFAAEFGSTQCRMITGCDFSTMNGVRRFIDGDGTATCHAIAERVARRVREMIVFETAATREA